MNLSRLAVLAPLLAAACTQPWNLPGAPVLQDARMRTSLADEIKAGTVTVQPVANGTRVTIQDQALFPIGSAQLNERGGLILTDVVQALLDPSLLKIGYSDASGLLTSARAQAVQGFLADAQLGPRLLPNAPNVVPDLAPAAPGTLPPQATTIVVGIAPG